MATGKGIVIQITGDGESARQALQMVQEHMRETAEVTKHEAGEMAEAMERVTRVLEFVGIYAGLEEIREGLKELVVGSLEMAESIEKASKKTGLSVESLSVLHYATGVLGEDFDGLVTAIGRMDKQIGLAADGNKQAGALMHALGLNAKDLAGRADGAEVAFHKFVETIASTENPIRRSQLAQELLGRAGAAQIPVLIEVAEHWDEFKEKAEAAGVALTAQTAAALADANKRLNDMKQHLQGAGLALTEGMIPGLEQMFGVMSGGKGHMEEFRTLGENLAKDFAAVAEVVYSVASAMETLFSLSEGGRLTKGGTKDADAAVELKKQAEEFHKIAFGNTPLAAPQPFLAPSEGGGGAHGFTGAPVRTGHTQSDNSFLTAAAKLVEEAAKAKADAVKHYDEQQLADLESQHKLMLVSDAEYYTEKLRLSEESLDAEERALRDKATALEQLAAKQHKDKTLKRGKDGLSAEEQQTQSQLLALNDQIGALESRRTQLQDQIATERVNGAAKVDLDSLKLAAELERERNDGITAQIALIEHETALEARQVAARGGSAADVANVQQLGQIKVEKLQLDDIEKRIGHSLADNKIKTDALNDAAAKGNISRKAAAQQVTDLNVREAAAVQNLVLQYDALAEKMGDPELISKAHELQGELNKMRAPDNKADGAWAKSLAEQMGGLAQRMADTAITGKKSFHDMAESILKDIETMAIKMAAQKWLVPALTRAFGGAADGPDPGFSGDGGGSGFDFGYSADGNSNVTSPQIVGERGPEVYMPPTRGGAILSNKDLAKSLASGGGGVAGGLEITHNVVNNSSQPVTAGQPQVSFDGRGYIITTVLEDLASGGHLAQALGR